jgi:cytoskeleton protein RodZ
VIRPRGGTTRRRDDEQAQATSSVEEIGRLLRDAREERGLDLLSVHDRLSRPITQIEALENGDLASLPDQALAVSTLRRYATFLGLDGDALALRMIDAWSVSSLSTSARATKDQSAVTSVVAAVSTGPDHLRAFTQTGPVPRVGGGTTGAPGGSGAYGYGVATGPPTGTFPVVPRQEIRHSKRAVHRSRRRLRAPTWLKVTTWLAAVLLVVVMVGFGIFQQRPEWLVRAHILRVAQPNGTAVAPPTAVSPPAHNTQKVAVQQVSTGGQSAAYAVNTKLFRVDIATTGPCWVQVTTSSSATPLVSGVQPAGKVLTFPATGTMTVQVGASAVVVGVAIKGKTVFFTTPDVTPFTYTFAPPQGS